MSRLGAVPLLRDLVRAPSPTGAVEPARRVLREHLEAADLDPREDEAGNLRARAGAGDRRVVLCGHLDTVPGGPTVREEDGWLWGRGSVDAKGPLAVLAAALDRLRDHPDLDLRFAAVPDEEGTSAGARHLARDLGAAEAVVVGEPNRARGYALGYRGNLRLEAEALAEPRHPAGPEPTAADRLHAWWAQVRDICQDESPEDSDRLFRQASPTLLSLETDRVKGRERARLEATVRTPSGLAPADLAPALEEDADGVEVRVRGREPPVETSPRAPVPAAFRAAIRHQGLDPRPVRKTGTCDLNVLAPALEAPGVAYGPGDSALDHTPDERVRLEEVRQAEAVLPEALDRLPERLDRGP